MLVLINNPCRTDNRIKNVIPEDLDHVGDVPIDLERDRAVNHQKGGDILRRCPLAKFIAQDTGKSFG